MSPGGPGVDRDDVGLESRQRLTIDDIARQVGPVDGQVRPVVNAPRAEPDGVIAVAGILGAPMRQAHVAETDKQNAQRCHE